MNEAQELYNALLEAKKIIRKWHAINLDPQVEEFMWNEHDNYSEQMKPINKVVEKYKHLNPATGKSGT